MTWQEWYPVLLKEAKDQIETAPKVSPSHKIDHILRVLSKAKAICEKLNGDPEIVVAAVLLHDFGRHHGLEIHGGKSAELAKPVLEKHNYPAEKIPLVLEAISQHDYNFPAEKRKLLESKILYDADKLDVFGVIGVYRYILFINAGRMTIEDVIPALDKRFNGLSFDESRDLAKKDYDYIVNFFNNLKEELKTEG